MSIDLSTHFGNLRLKSPVIVGACPLTAEEMMQIAMVSAGAGAIVLPSLFEEQVIDWNTRHGYACHRPSSRSEQVREQQVVDYTRQMKVGTICEDAESYLELVKRTCSQISIPVIASLNGQCAGNWVDFAQELEAAGVSGIELYVRHPAPHQHACPREIEDAILETAEILNRVLTIPLFFKLGRNYTSLSHLAEQLSDRVQGLVLFGHSPALDISLASLQVTHKWGMTPAGSVARSLESIMRVHGYCPAMSLAANGGIATSEDLIKVLLAGADAAMITSAVYRNGPTVIGTLIEGLIHFMEQQQIQSLIELKVRRSPVFDSYDDRLDYIKAVSSKLESSTVRCGGTSTIECDRWGHPRSPR